MIHRIIFFLSLFILVSACSNQSGSKHPYADFFFPYDEEVKVYVYRDQVQGMNEKYYRVYGVTDSKGKHVVVENYTMDGRITEATNYNLDSLYVLDHMVVDRNKKKTKALLIKNTFFPRDKADRTWFSSKFPGFLDSTIIVSETKRNFDQSTPIKAQVMGTATNTVVMLDTVRLTALNLITKKENELSSVFKSHYGEGIGLVRMHDLQMKTNFELERIISQKEWVEMMKR